MLCSLYPDTNNGAQYNPEQEEAYREILELEKKCKNIENNMEEVNKEVNVKTVVLRPDNKFVNICYVT